MKDKRKTLHKFILLLIYYFFLFHYYFTKIIPIYYPLPLAEDILPSPPPYTSSLSLRHPNPKSKLGLIVIIIKDIIFKWLTILQIFRYSMSWDFYTYSIWN